MMIHVHVPKYLCWSNVVLSACHLIKRMLSSVLNDQVLFYCLYPNKSLFFMVPRAFGCTYFVQDLSPSLDKLSHQSIKCTFVGYYRTQK